MNADFSVSRTTSSLRQWLEAPALAPDNEAKIQQSAGELEDLNAASVNGLESLAILADNHDLPALLQAKRELDSLNKRPLIRLDRWLRGAKGR